jgi:hypothetical protein
MPIVMFHGTNYNVIPYESSLKLRKLLKPSDTLITLKGLGHNGITEDPIYLEAMHEILNR